MKTSEWNYSKIIKPEHLYNLQKSPQNFIDDLKLKHIYSNIIFPINGIVVEIGCGSGRLSTRIGINHSNIKIIGIDLEENAVKLANANYKNFNLNAISICGDTFYIPLKTNSVDIIISGGLLEHFTYDQSNLIIQEMYRVLKPGGWFYADIVPNKSSLCRPIIFTQCGGFENNFNIKKWNNILKINNFKITNSFKGLVIPPNFYGRFKSGIKLIIMYKIQPYLNKLDNTFIGNILGFAYYIFARKPYIL